MLEPPEAPLLEPLLEEDPPDPLPEPLVEDDPLDAPLEPLPDHPPDAPLLLVLPDPPLEAAPELLPEPLLPPDPLDVPPPEPLEPGAIEPEVSFPEPEQAMDAQARSAIVRSQPRSPRRTAARSRKVARIASSFSTPAGSAAHRGEL